VKPNDAKPRTPVVFIGHDPVMLDAFRQLTEKLQARGIRVIQGPTFPPGEKYVYPPDSWVSLFGATDVAVFSSRSLCSDGILAAAPHLRGVVVPTIGVETIDVAAATRHGILVGHAPTPENRTGMAEATVMLILMQLYSPIKTHEVLLGQRQRPMTGNARWASLLAGKTVGIVGYGGIGREVARRLTGFGVRLLATGRPGKNLERDAGVNIEQVDLDTLMRTSDVVTIHITITPETDGLIGARELALMKPDAYLINTSRGEAIDETALYEILASRRIAGAALDCFRIEPLPETSPLRTLDNVFLTPHLVGQTRDSIRVIPEVAVENVVRLLHGNLPLYCKNPEAVAAWKQRIALLDVLSA